MNKLIICVFLVSRVGSAQEQAAPRADKIFVHANVYTGVAQGSAFKAIRRAQAIAVRGDRILGGGWDETLWPVKTVPTRWDVDEVSGDHPVFLGRVDGHIAVANTRA